ncbi:hypothetical protein, partial [Ralstonia edaphi]|uniref:hypothetical protein n=1 Tax=Ralstonia edaphi TaxID=3058599 RepID=UPI00292E9225
RKALIYKGSWVIPKTPKAGVAGSIPAGRAKNQRLPRLVRFSHARTALPPQRAGLPIPEPYSAPLRFRSADRAAGMLEEIVTPSGVEL